MVATWIWMTLTVLIGWIYWRRGRLFDTPWVLWVLELLPFSHRKSETRQAGFRPKWGAILGLYRTCFVSPKDFPSRSQPGKSLAPFILFGVLLFFSLSCFFIYLLNEKIRHGPTETKVSSPYPQLSELMNTQSEKEGASCFSYKALQFIWFTVFCHSVDRLTRFWMALI